MALASGELRFVSKRVRVAAAVAVIATVAVIGVAVVVSGDEGGPQQNDHAPGVEALEGRQVVDMDSAIEAIEAYLGTAGTETVFEPFNTSAPGEFTFHRATPTYRGIPVIGQAMITMTGHDGEILAVAGNHIDATGINTEPTFTETAATEAALAIFDTGARAHSAELMIDSRDGDTRLVWRVTILGYLGGSPDWWLVTVDAQNGVVVDEVGLTSRSNPSHGPGQEGGARRLTWWNVDGAYALGCQDRSILITSHDYRSRPTIWEYADVPTVLRGWNAWAWQSYVVDHGAHLAANDALYNTAVVFDFFSDHLGRRSFDNQGGKLRVVVDVLRGDAAPGPGFGRNAFWMNGVYGFDGIIGFEVPVRGVPQLSANLDVVAHEFVHGVSWTVWRAYGLGDNTEAGAINEALSDILGEIVEQYYLTTSGAGRLADWIVGPGFRDFRTGRGQQFDSTVHYPHANAPIINYVAYRAAQAFDLTDQLQLVAFARLWYGTMNLLPHGQNATFGRLAASTMMFAHSLSEAGEITPEQFRAVIGAFVAQGIEADWTWMMILDQGARETIQGVIDRFNENDSPSEPGQPASVWEQAEAAFREFMLHGEYLAFVAEGGLFEEMSRRGTVSEGEVAILDVDGDMQPELIVQQRDGMGWHANLVFAFDPSLDAIHFVGSLFGWHGLSHCPDTGTLMLIPYRGSGFHSMHVFETIDSLRSGFSAFALMSEIEEAFNWDGPGERWKLEGCDEYFSGCEKTKLSISEMSRYFDSLRAIEFIPVSAFTQIEANG